jgi:quercetin dioxygenase-like cupin family protein
MLKKIGIAAALAGAFAAGAYAQRGQTVDRLLDTSTTVAGSALRYPTAGAAKFTANISTLDPGGETPRHLHPVPTFIYVLEGTLAVDVDGAGTREVKAGNAFMEVVDTWHRNRNPSTGERVRYLLVFAHDDKTAYVVRPQ